MVTYLKTSALRVKVVTVCNHETVNGYTPNVLQISKVSLYCNHVTVKFRYSIEKTDYIYYRLIFNTAY